MIKLSWELLKTLIFFLSLSQHANLSLDYCCCKYYFNRENLHNNNEFTATASEWEREKMYQIITPTSSIVFFVVLSKADYEMNYKFARNWNLFIQEVSSEIILTWNLIIFVVLNNQLEKIKSFWTNFNKILYYF